MVKNILIIQPTDFVQWDSFSKFRETVKQDIDNGVLIINSNVNYQLVSVDDIKVR